jgi:hypothetical protein
MELEDFFIQVIIRNEKEYREYAEIYNLDFEIARVDFSENGILLISKHEVKEFSYNEKNSRNYMKGKKNILDIIFYKEETKKIYIYEIPHIYMLVTWDETPSYRAVVFEE